MKPVLNDSKNSLTKMRRQFLAKYRPRELAKLLLLEQKFGKYIFLPYDVAPIKPNDPERFVAWYNEHSKPINKIASDVAGGSYSGKNFRSINSDNQLDKIWQQNKRTDIFTEFPELKEGVKQLPFFGDAEFAMWSSLRPVSLHRDQGAWEDLPASFRIMLHDTNPEETLFIRERPPELLVQNDNPLLMLNRSDTNVFGWNNVRTAHGSTWRPGFFKVLMIFTRAKFDLDRYEDLLNRSVAKYGHLAHVSQHELKDFVSC